MAELENEHSEEKELGVHDNIIKYVFFVALMGIVYIANQYMADERLQRAEKLKNEVKELRAEFKIKKAALSRMTIRKSIKETTDTLGLIFDNKKIKKIVIRDEY